MDKSSVKVFLKGAGELGQSQVIKLELCLQYIIDAAVIFPTVFPLPEQISSSKARNSVYVHISIQGLMD